VHRFFAPSLDPGDHTVVLPKTEAEHLTRVLRIGTGETVAVFDGRGNEFLARVGAIRRSEVTVHLLSRVDRQAEAPVAITLVQGVLKGDKMDEVVRDAVMLGVVAIQPVVTRRTEATVGALLRGARPDRWRRVALASTKQCGRAVLPEIHTPLTLEHYLDEPAPALRLMLVEPAASADAPPLADLRDLPVPPDAAVLIGPEGGWEQAERATAVARGVRAMTLGPRILRADAVPIAALSILQFMWDRFK
jgi:16S rRNA (uracil1498-N3)-methyltransferase